MLDTSRREYFAAHAPPAPDWYVPDGVDVFDPGLSANELGLLTIARWPWAYADATLAAENPSTQQAFGGGKRAENAAAPDSFANVPDRLFTEDIDPRR